MKKAAIRYAEILEAGAWVTHQEQEDIAKLLRRLAMTEDEAWDLLEAKQNKAKAKPKNNIKELAEQAGFTFDTLGATYTSGSLPQILEHFAELVAEQTHTNNKAKWYQEGYEAGQRDEREACAHTCDINADGDWTSGALACAAAIRARGNKHD